jgi:hypothetical protein
MPKEDRRLIFDYSETYQALYKLSTKSEDVKKLKPGRGGPTLLDRLAAKLSYKLLVCVMPPRLFFAPVFVHSVAGRSPRPEEQNLVYYRPHLAFVH